MKLLLLRSIDLFFLSLNAMPWVYLNGQWRAPLKYKYKWANCMVEKASCLVSLTCLHWSPYWNFWNMTLLNSHAKIYKADDSLAKFIYFISIYIFVVKRRFVRISRVICCPSFAPPYLYKENHYYDWQSELKLQVWTSFTYIIFVFWSLLISFTFYYN